MSRYDDRQGLGFSFDRLDVDLRQYVSFLSERRVLVGRVAASTSNVEPDEQVPFYLMPYPRRQGHLARLPRRFRGPHALLLQGEYRFEIWSGLDGALFYDAGKVALRRSQLDLEIWNRTMALVSGSIPTEASSRASMRRLGVVMANISGLSLAARSKAAVTVAAVLILAGGVFTASTPRFYPDDPLFADDDALLDASRVVAVEDASSYDFVVNTFASQASVATSVR